MRAPFWLGLAVAVLLASLFYPFVLLFGVAMLIVGIAGAITGRRR